MSSTEHSAPCYAVLFGMDTIVGPAQTSAAYIVQMALSGDCCVSKRAAAPLRHTDENSEERGKKEGREVTQLQPGQ